MLLIPSIDLRGGCCVRLLRGDFAAETRYDLEPHELLGRYRALGASWLHIVDLDGARDGQLANRSLLLTLASQRAVNLQVGGGVRSLAVVDDLLRNGVDRVVVGSAAIEEPAAVAQWLTQFGPERVCLAFDVKADDDGVPRVQTRGWTRGTRLSLWDAVAGFVDAGLCHVLCTDVQRDGALEGPSLALYAEALRRYPQLRWQASGGVRDAADLAALSELGVAAAISGKALLEERITAAALRPYLAG
ncbi:MAG: 1-(5-phosphoribosyl)-5-[(5-phosphoribosylamino)methylideneamino] imidazole-4-carboxamide isomerase [Steroidobacteraceae bacterium]|nr:1-(5-phosphoribosyl)-5-[(5-phosphoribosylamino)methylideneamino] imidazole-4-carboxamide isomerase [Nevskiaceae bacterium]MCP5339117.1 1-(5-phosphoribosyl)-5-[(5-phosphoribosylamino)methylideneamino] imidazole-4-carboxamide isomerase [Nevskiaceae bacterium]MCP5360026.1 1-(5-phosphoribosyl)-5-[(5-phosphoribosylamino)methylideneamino] imidazole-4-carboxamide isomerase [Nevskiaceae bacterium]MCP5472154.1 1-(5-phosphoribosyl)-5-[(5-phosphoribosylamino)methylideneamino] imidazole-4-carboxamide iso